MHAVIQRNDGHSNKVMHVFLDGPKYQTAVGFKANEEAEPSKEVAPREVLSKPLVANLQYEDVNFPFLGA